MQPAVFNMLQVAAAAAGCDACLMDTHSPGQGLSDPDVRPDATSLVGPCTVATWPHVVCTWEFKVGWSCLPKFASLAMHLVAAYWFHSQVSNGKTDVDTMVGQLLQRRCGAMQAWLTFAVLCMPKHCQTPCCCAMHVALPCWMHNQSVRASLVSASR